MTMRTSTAYFAGVGTVVAAVAAGLGGGYLAANVVSPHEPGVSKLERRMSAAQTAATTAPSEPVARIVATTTAAASPQYEAQQTPQASAQPEPRIAASDVAAPAEEKTASAPRPAQPASTKPSDQVGEKEVVTKPAAPLDAFARARDIDIKRAAAEKRRAERRARWEEKRRVRQPREQELEAVEQRVREVTEPRQAFAAEQVRSGSTQIRLFDLD
jgi:hypothetical protein